MFIFSLAKTLKKTVRQIETEMGADELMEWVAYFKTQDEASVKVLRREMAAEATEAEQVEELRAFLTQFS